MTEFSCPKCEGGLDNCFTDGLVCHACSKFYPEYQVQKWIEEEFRNIAKQHDEESQDYQSLDDGEEDPDLEDKDLED